jgi:hypothetical protein
MQYFIQRHTTGGAMNKALESMKVKRVYRDSRGIQYAEMVNGQIIRVEPKEKR